MTSDGKKRDVNATSDPAPSGARKVVSQAPGMPASQGAPAGDQNPPAKTLPRERERGSKPTASPGAKVKETGGPKGPEPTRFGDWERNGICIDF